MISSTSTRLLARKRIARADQVDDRIGETDQRRQFHRTVQLDQVDVHALGGEMLACDFHVLGRDAQTRALAHRVRVIETCRDRHRHPAARDIQIDRLIQTAAAVLEQHVLARHAEVRRAVFDVGRHVGGAHDDHAQVRIRGRQDQLARGFRIFGDFDAGCREQRQRLLEDTPFRQRQRQRRARRRRRRSLRHRAHCLAPAPLMRRTFAPIAVSFASMRS